MNSWDVSFVYLSISISASKRFGLLSQKEMQPIKTEGKHSLWLALETPHSSLQIAWHVHRYNRNGDGIPAWAPQQSKSFTVG